MNERRNGWGGRVGRGRVRCGVVRCGKVGLERGHQWCNTAADCQGATPWAVAVGWVGHGPVGPGLSVGANGTGDAWFTGVRLPGIALPERLGVMIGVWRGKAGPGKVGSGLGVNDAHTGGTVYDVTLPV